MSANEFAADARPDFVRPDKFRKNAPVPVPVPVPIPYPNRGVNRGSYVRSYGTDVTPTIRALRSRANSHAMKKTTPKTDAMTRRIVVIMREVLATQRLESIADFIEAVKCRCGQLRVPWTAEALDHAYRLLKSNQPMPMARPPRSSAPLRAHDYIPRLSRLEAAALVRRLLDVTGKTLRAMR